MNKKRVAYFMHIPWGWIKQRPHFVAQELYSVYDINLYVPKTYRGSRLSGNETLELKIKQIFVLPLTRFGFVRQINKILLRLILGKIDADIYWFTAPYFYPMVKNKIPSKALVVYDCMDDVLEFPSVKTRRNVYDSTLKTEKELFLRSDHVFTTSNHLRSVLLSRYGDRKVSVNYNAVTDKKPVIDLVEQEKFKSQFNSFFSEPKKKIVYIGTVASWLDIGTVMECISPGGVLSFHVFGPQEIDAKSSDIVTYYGAIQHKFVDLIMATADVLIMPFLLSDLIRSVNPVKLYEYIGSGKPCISVYYKELDQFADYVHFYNTKQDLQRLFSELSRNSLRPKLTVEEARSFLKENTWASRVKQLVAELENLASNAKLISSRIV